MKTRAALASGKYWMDLRGESCYKEAIPVVLPRPHVYVFLLATVVTHEPGAESARLTPALSPQRAERETVHVTLSPQRGEGRGEG